MLGLLGCCIFQITVFAANSGTGHRKEDQSEGEEFDQRVAVVDTALAADDPFAVLSGLLNGSAPDDSTATSEPGAEEQPDADVADIEGVVGRSGN